MDGPFLFVMHGKENTMFNESFYPTPAPVAQKMLARLTGKRLRNANILEPSAGKGDLAEAILEAMKAGLAYGNYKSLTPERIRCVEIHPELQATLRGKGFLLVGTDFLTFHPDEKYDLIVMNPPFADGDKHLLHAWNILEHGDVLCLLNEQTLANQSTANRKLLARIISEHGDVKPLGACFSDAFRKTRVRVCLVHLKKEAATSAFIFTVGKDKDPYAQFIKDGQWTGEVATHDIVGNLVADYDRCRQLFLDVSAGLMELGFHVQRLSGYSADSWRIFEQAARNLITEQPSREQQERAYNAFVWELKRNAWDKVFQLTRFGNLVSETVRNELDKLMQENRHMAFSRDNIISLVAMLIENRDNIMRQCVVDAFDILTRYHKENRVHVEGWLTNDAWKVNRRAILPCVVDTDWISAPRCRWEATSRLDDIDRALAFLEGKALDAVPCTIKQSLDMLFKQYGGNFSGVSFQSTYFTLRCYKKGTLHLQFRDETLWERFNIMAATGKNWLPDDTKTRHKEEQDRNHYADQMGLPLAV